MAFIGDSYREPGKVQVTYALIAVNCLSFFVVFYKMDPNQVFSIGGIIPSEWFESTVAFSAHRPPEVISMIWSFFLHGGWLHLFFNMFALYLFGPNLEARMGRLNFFLFYLSCASAGALFQVLQDAESQIPIIGASGAVAGLLGGYWVLFRDHFIRIDFGKRAKKDLIFPVYTLILFWVILQVVNGFFPGHFLKGGKVQSVAYFSHIGGFVCGFFLTYYQTPKDKKSQPRFRVFTGGKR